MTLNHQSLNLQVPEKGHTATYLGIPLEFPPLVYIMPTFATCLTQVIEHMPSTAKLSMTAKSALYLEGNVDIEGTVEIDGALVVKAGPGAKIVIKSLKVQNKGWKMVEVGFLS
jgi:UDP-sugar pyrophosphorylase